MKVVTNFYVTALMLLHVREVYSQACVNNQNYSYGSDETHTCNWVRTQDDREELCDKEDVILNCPISCAVCCEDDPMYSFLTIRKVEVNCEWLDKKAKTKKYCDTYRNGQMVRSGCPKACDYCIKAVTVAPTQSTIVCEDNASYVYNDNVNHTCNWVRNKRREDLCLKSEVVMNCPFSCGHCCEDNSGYRIERDGKPVKKCGWLNNDHKRSKWCNTSLKGQMVRRGCPKSCDFCLSKITPSPSAVPSSSQPTKLSTDMPTDTPTKAPSIPPTNKPTNAPVIPPTNKPTNAPINPPTKKPVKTKNPVSAPTKKPVAKPTKRPRQRTKAPVTPSPTTSPVTSSPTTSPTLAPTKSPTASPTASPTTAPTKSPTSSPTKSPTSSPTSSPTNSPTSSPTNSPTSSPTDSPTLSPTNGPTLLPIYPYADSYVYSNTPSDNYGTEIVVVVKNDPYYTRTGLMRFNTTLYKDAGVSSATLKMWVRAIEKGGNAEKDITVSRIKSNPWTETGVTWTNLNAEVDKVGTTETITDPMIKSFVSFDITDLYDNSNTDLLLMLQITSAAGAKEMVYLESRDSENPPFIVFELGVP